MRSESDVREFARSALEGAEVGFVVFRALRRGDAIDGPLEWVVLDANASVRDRWLTDAVEDEPGETGVSAAVSRSEIAPILEKAMTAGERVEVDHQLHLPDGTSSWRRA